jgi:hypothetical protein
VVIASRAVASPGRGGVRGEILHRCLPEWAIQSLLLPVIDDAVDVEVAGLVLVDSRLPPPAGRSPLGAPEFMDQLRAMASDGLLPKWSRWFGLDTMRELVSDERLRADLEAEMPRLPLSYFEASVPLPGPRTRLGGGRDARRRTPGDGERPDCRHRRASRPRNARSADRARAPHFYSSGAVVRTS